MRMIFVFFALIFLSLRLIAQPLYPNKAYIHSYFTDVKTFKKEIFHPSEKAILGTWSATALTLLLTQLDGDIKLQTQNWRTPNSEKITKYLEPFGRGETTLGIASGVYLCGLLTKNQTTQATGLTSIKCLLFTDLIIGGLKLSIQRTRPSYTDNPANFHGLWNTRSNLSFPSGHSAASFALATALCSGIKNKYWHIPIYMIASGVALSRVHDNKHWASDVFVGSLIGCVTAHIVIHANNWNWQNKSKQQKPFSE
jgi:PAP2 superfamily